MSLTNPGRGLTVALLALTLAACASAAGELPGVDLSEVPREGALPAFNYDYSIQPGGTVLSEELVEREIRSVLKPAFEGFDRGRGDHRYQVNLAFQNERGTLRRTAAVFLSVVTLALLPVRQKDPLRLDVDVSAGGELLRSYSYADRIDTWIWALMIPIDPERRRSRVAAGIVDSMLFHFLRDLEADRLPESQSR